MRPGDEADIHELSPMGRFLWSAGPPTLRVLGRVLYSLRVEQQAPLPPAPYVVAANHFSHLDPPLVGAVIGEPVRFLAVDELIGVSAILDYVLDWFGAIPLPRRGLPLRAIRTALERLEAGEIVGVFPEGTRVRKWGDLEPKRGAAWLARRAGVPLIPMAVIGTDEAFGLDHRWHWARLRVVVGAPIDDGDPETMTSDWENWISTRLSRFATNGP